LNANKEKVKGLAVCVKVVFIFIIKSQIGVHINSITPAVRLYSSASIGFENWHTLFYYVR
jgi:hypothetical protein